MTVRALRNIVFILRHQVKFGGRKSCVSLAVIIAIVSIVFLSIGIIAGYFIGKNKFETVAEPTPKPAGMVGRSDEEKREYYTGVINEMKAENIRSNLK